MFCPRTHGERKRRRKYILVLKDLTQDKKQETVHLQDKLGVEAEDAQDFSKLCVDQGSLEGLWEEVTFESIRQLWCINLAIWKTEHLWVCDSGRALSSLGSEGAKMR